MGRVSKEELAKWKWNFKISKLKRLMQEVSSLRKFMKHEDASERPWPFMDLLRGSRWNPLQCFVIVERQAIPFPTIARAVDIAFKQNYILDVDYQPQLIWCWRVCHGRSKSLKTMHNVTCVKTWIAMFMKDNYHAFTPFSSIYRKMLEMWSGSVF